jgi:hypothetical protein
MCANCVLFSPQVRHDFHTKEERIKGGARHESSFKNARGSDADERLFDGRLCYHGAGTGSATKSLAGRQKPFLPAVAGAPALALAQNTNSDPQAQATSERNVPESASAQISLLETQSPTRMVNLGATSSQGKSQLAKDTSKGMVNLGTPSSQSRTRPQLDARHPQRASARLASQPRLKGQKQFEKSRQGRHDSSPAINGWATVMSSLTGQMLLSFSYKFFVQNSTILL